MTVAVVLRSTNARAVSAWSSGCVKCFDVLPTSSSSPRPNIVHRAALTRRNRPSRLIRATPEGASEKAVSNVASVSRWAASAARRSVMSSNHAMR